MNHMPNFDNAQFAYDHATPPDDDLQNEALWEEAVDRIVSRLLASRDSLHQLIVDFHEDMVEDEMQSIIERAKDDELDSQIDYP